MVNNTFRVVTQSVETLAHRMDNLEGMVRNGNGQQQTPNRSSVVNRNDLNARVLPKVRLLFDTDFSIAIGWAPVTYVWGGEEKKVVVFSITATKQRLLAWDSTFNPKILDRFLSVMTMSMELPDVSPAERACMMLKTPFEPFVGPNPNRDRYKIIPQPAWRAFMQEIETTYDDLPAEIPKEVKEMKIHYKQMTQCWAVEGSGNPLWEHSTGVIEKLERPLSLAERKTCPPCGPQWWREACQGPADYYGFDMEEDFYHVRNGVYNPDGTVEGEEGVNDRVRSFKANMMKMQELAENEKNKKKGGKVSGGRKKKVVQEKKKQAAVKKRPAHKESHVKARDNRHSRRAGGSSSSRRSGRRDEEDEDEEGEEEEDDDVPPSPPRGRSKKGKASRREDDDEEEEEDDVPPSPPRGRSKKGKAPRRKDDDGRSKKGKALRRPQSPTTTTTTGEGIGVGGDDDSDDEPPVETSQRSKKGREDDQEEEEEGEVLNPRTPPRVETSSDSDSSEESGNAIPTHRSKRVRENGEINNNTGEPNRKKRREDA